MNSTAVVDNVTLSDNGTTLKCSENVDLGMFSETVLIVAGEYICIHSHTGKTHDTVVHLMYRIHYAYSIQTH